MPENYEELARRCEEATGADRKLDIEIARAIELLAGTRASYHLNGLMIPSCTASIDAALSLVPEGLSFEVRSSGTGDKGQATVWDPMRAPGMREWRVTGCATPALALCAASLRARAAEHHRSAS